MSSVDWSAYLVGLSAIAGTLFALVLAARQIRGSLRAPSDNAARRYYLFDSISVTVELGIAALLAALSPIGGSFVFTFFAMLATSSGAVAVSLVLVNWVRARRAGQLQNDRGQTIQAIGNILPLTCYAVAFAFAVGILSLGTDWVQLYAGVVTWLVFSGAFQAIVWYASMWRHAKDGAEPETA